MTHPLCYQILVVPMQQRLLIFFEIQTVLACHTSQYTVTYKELSSTLVAGVGCVLTTILLGPATCGVLLVGSLETSGGLECLLVGVANIPV